MNFARELGFSNFSRDQASVAFEKPTYTATTVKRRALDNHDSDNLPRTIVCFIRARGVRRQKCRRTVFLLLREQIVQYTRYTCHLSQI